MYSSLNRNERKHCVSDGEREKKNRGRRSKLSYETAMKNERKKENSLHCKEKRWRFCGRLLMLNVHRISHAKKHTLLTANSYSYCKRRANHLFRCLITNKVDETSSSFYALLRLLVQFLNKTKKRTTLKEHVNQS